MGFGILFVGYFLLLNFAYSYFTDAIAAAVMMYAFYKLSGVNSGFKRALYTSIGFLLFGIGELVLSVMSTVFPLVDLSLLQTVMAMIRHLVIFTLTFFMLSGIKEVAKEVDLPYLAKRCTRNIFIALPIYALNILLEARELAVFIDAKVLLTLYFISLILTMAIICLNLVQIYGAHMRIYIPGEEKEEEQSRFGFVNAFRRHEEERSREYAEYKLQKAKEKKEKKEKK